MVVSLFGVRAFIGIVGMMLNTGLVYVIYKNRSLHTSCSFLMALNAVCNMLYELSFVINAVVSAGLTPQGFQVIPLRSCLYLQIVPTFSTNSSVMLLFFIGTDRLLHAIFPVPFHGHRRLMAYYLIFVCGFCGTYAAYIVYGCVRASSNVLESYVTCGINDLYIRDIGDTIIIYNMVLSLASVLCYICVWIVLKKRKRQGSGTIFVGDNAAQRVFKSLSVAMFLAFFGWFLYSAYSIALKYFLQLTFVQTWCIGAALSQLMALESASYAPVLYIFSKEYRRAFRRHILTLCRKFGLMTTVSGSSVMNLQSIVPPHSPISPQPNNHFFIQ
ncbi:serpentine type 7TM GPCR chemoreceptor srsx domain-containing protein [Ditylenchus destructor]|uniref:Serpentine type 7TM GPCR chemoreceptor srsx domain-containing protein n=1 Tax=Ditylenchus destructor TaxID=166010 RepID=A0AAD4MRL7_9BILA|nr:serpentine type 7TM GPCR chemoreceptor srsx domain-containing protein [Ditylenchus destructor]